MPFKDPEKKREYDKAYQAKHKDEPKVIALSRKRSAAYHAKHREKEKLRHSVYRDTHQKEILAYREKKRIRKK